MKLKRNQRILTDLNGFIDGGSKGGRVEDKKQHSNNSLPSMGSLCFGFHPSTLASTLQILYIFYIISFLDLKKYIRNMIYMGGIY
jgi:hypothetical protein